MGSFFDGMLAVAVAMTWAGITVDYMIYKKEERRVRDWLDDLWLKLEYVQLTNFAKKEAEFFVSFLDWVASPHFLSWKRLATSICVCIAAKLVALVRFLHMNGYDYEQLWLLGDGNGETDYPVIAVSVAVCVPTVMASFSFTRWLCLKMAQMAGSSIFRNLAVFLGFMAFHVLLMICWVPIVEVLRSHFVGLSIYISRDNIFVEILYWFIDTKPDNNIFYSMWQGIARNMEYIRDHGLISWFVSPFHVDFQLFMAVGRRELHNMYYHKLEDGMTSYLTNGSRIFGAAAFGSACLIHPMAKDAVSRLLYGIIERKIPLGTMILGGTGAAMKLIHEVIKQFGEAPPPLSL